MSDATSFEKKMIKSIQFFTEVDQSRVLVALDLKAAFQNVSRRSMLYSLGQHDPDLATVFSRWYTGSTTHRMHYEGILRTPRPAVESTKDARSHHAALQRR